MKTISSPSEFDNVLSSSNGGVVTCVPSKTTEESNQGHNNIFDCQAQGDNEETESLIICNSNLTSAFQTAKSDKSKVSPGHYLQKVFFNYSVAQKLRSQSLPNCVDKKKYPENSGVDDCSKDLLKNREVSGNDNCENAVGLRETIHCEGDGVDTTGLSCNNDTWFKTWPERGGGVDKKPVKQNDDKSHLAQSESNGTANLSGFKLNSYDVRTNSEKQLESVKKQESSDNSSTGFGNSPVHLNCVLQNIPLGYSPVTKQLHIIKTSSNIESQKDSGLKFSISGSNNDYSVKLTHGSTSVNKHASVTCDDSTTSKHVQNSDTVPSLTSNCNSGSNLTRVATESSCCSYSSTLSSLSDVSPSTNDDSALGSLLGLDHGDSCSLASIGECSILSEDSNGAASASVGSKQKKKSFSGFFTRNVFGWKSSSGEDGNVSQHNRLGRMVSSGSGSGWKLFSRSNATAGSTMCRSGHSGYESGGGGESTTPGSPCSVRSSNSIGCNSTSSRVRSHENIIASSTALIQLDRPACLPAKSQEELENHRQQYQDMVDAARKKELKEVKLRKRQLQLQLRVEEQQAQAARTWSQEILPKWEMMCVNRKTRELWWLGIPPCVRGKVWRLAISNELNLTQQLFDICCIRAHDMLKAVDVEENSGNESSDNKEASVQLIQLDISRTFPNLCIFQQGGPYYDMLHCLLGAYVCYRPDVGYVQGMSFIAAVLILNMDVSDAFICFANLLNRPCLMAFFSLNQPLMQAYYATYNDLLSENLPHVYKHFVSSHLTPDLYLLDWIYTVFTKAMNLDLASRVWDVFLRDGEEFLFRAALGVLHLCQDTLLKMDFVHGSQYLTRLPDDLPADQLFKSISNIKMNVGKQTFEQILAFHTHELESANIQQQ